MKKIGYVIAYREGHNNYGTSLQGVALLKKIQDLGCDCEIIRYHKQLSFFAKLRLLFLMFRCGGTTDKLLSLKHSINLKLHSDYAKGESQRTESVNLYKKKKLIPYFKEYVGFDALQKGSLNYDAVLVGSDQVWTPMSLYSKYYNLLFVDDKVNKIAYASSFGVSEIPNFQKKDTAEYLNRFTKIGVRELQGQKIVNSLSEKNAVVVADPTLLLTKEEWTDEIADSSVDISEPYIFVYFLGKNQDARKAVNELKRHVGYKIVTIKNMDEYVSSDDTFGDESPFCVDPNDFVKYISNAAYVCTDSFHCTVFSIIFQRKFMTFYRYAKVCKNSRNSRIDSLFSMLCIKNRLFLGNNILDIEASIDYDCVSSRLKSIRDSSIEFLRDGLANN